MIKLLSILLFIAAPAAAWQGNQARNAHAFSFTSIEGEPMPLEAYAGQVILLVNTASFCGFTNQYAGLQALYERYQDRGLVVIGVPSGSFDQEYESVQEVKYFCETNFGITFSLTDKNDVVGQDAHPFYRWARQELGAAAAPRWNFHKYLIGRDGELLDWFPSNTRPEAPRLITAIDAALAGQDRGEASKGD
ncbi:MAG: glutathione peroxidase [Rhodothalassiaceae bacterium]